MEPDTPLMFMIIGGMMILFGWAIFENKDGNFEKLRDAQKVACFVLVVGGAIVAVPSLIIWLLRLVYR